MGKTVDMSQYPALLEAMLTIRHDIGCPVSCDDHPIPFPSEYLVHAPIADAYLSTLSVRELQEFCTGEESVARGMAARSNIAQLAHDFLNDFFDGYDPASRRLCGEHQPVQEQSDG